MANVDIRVGKKDAVFFSANPTLILKDGQFLFNSDTLELFIGDGTSQLSALVAINVPPSSGVQSVTGSNVDNTDPVNPVVNTPTLQQVITESDVVTGELAQSADGGTIISINDENIENYSQDSTGNNISVRQQTPTQTSDLVTDLVNSVQTKTTINGFIVDDYNVTASTPTMFNSSKGVKSLTASVWGSFIAGLYSKTTPVNADSIEISDSAASNTAKKLTLTNFKAFLKTYFDAIYTTTSAVATQISTALSGYLTAATAASIYQKLREVISSNKTAVLDEFYTVNSTCTFTDPTPSEGKGYTVFVINGTVTVGGVAYSTAGTKIERVYYSGAWVNYVYGKLEKELLCSFNSTNLADVVDYRFGNTYLPATLSASVSREFPFPLNGKIKEIVFTGISSLATSSIDCVLKITTKTTGVTTTVGNIRFDNITLKVTFAGLNILGSKGDACEVVFSTPAFPTNGTGSQGSALLLY